MPALFLYLIKFSCALCLSWLFYRLVLHSLTFYTWNRWYLLGYSLLGFLIPFVNIGPIGREDPALQPLIIQYIPVIDKPMPAIAAPIAAHSIHTNPWTIGLIVLGLGSCFLLLRFLFRCYSLKKLRQKAVLLQKGPVNIFRVHEPVSPFSFGNAIYVNTDQHTEKEWEEIILHEYVHIRQHHTLDILFGEWLVIVNWYNPFAWLIRFSIRQNLEFIADRAVVDNGVDKKGYQYHLLKVLGQTRYRIANNFNFSSLKKRIIMMNKIRSARLHLLRFLFILPSLAILLVAFRDRFPIHHSEKDVFVNVAGIAITMPDHKPMSGVIVKEFFTGLQTTTDARILQIAHLDHATRTTATQNPSHHPAIQHPAPTQPANAQPAATDTVPHHHDTLPLNEDKVLWVVDGVIKPQGWKGGDSIKPDDILHMSILKGDKATELFGNAGADGVIAILTRSGQNSQAGMPVVKLNNDAHGSPLYIVDGTMSQGDMTKINPADIQSIIVLKDAAAKAQYGEKGRYGVVQITTKRSTRPHAVLQTTDAKGKPMTMIVDSLYTAPQITHDGNSKPDH